MHQIKYVLSACLILLMIFMAIFLYKTFPVSGIIAQNQTIIDDNSTASGKVASKGEQVFKQNCASCHAMDKALSAPGLRGVQNRGPWAEDINNIKLWIKDPQSFMKHNLYTQKLKEAYNGLMMPQFSNLTDDQIEMIIEYITTPEQNGPY